jgi:hypothetical protein
MRRLHGESAGRRLSPPACRGRIPGQQDQFAAPLRVRAAHAALFAGPRCVTQVSFYGVIRFQQADFVNNRTICRLVFVHIVVESTHM